MNDSCPRVLAILPAFILSTQICIVKPLMRLHQEKLLEAKITLEYLVRRENLEWADLVIFCRNTEPRYAWILDFILSRSIPFVYDIDDNFFEIPNDSEQGRYHRHSERLTMHQQYIRSAGLVRVYSYPLLERMKTLNTNTEKVSGPIDWDLISPLQTNLGQNPIKIVYATSRFDDGLAALFIPAIKRVMDQYCEKVEIHFWGFKPSRLTDRYRVHYHPVVPDYDRFLRRFSRAGFDIGLAPLKDDVFHRSKTNNKFREYGACRIAGIYSNMDVYSNCVSDGETGLLVSNNTDSWYRAIIRLVEEHGLREKIKRQAFEYLRLHYPEKDFERVWWSQIRSILAGKGVSSLSNPSVYHEGFQSPSKIAYIKEGRRKLTRHLNDNGIHFTIRLLMWKLFDRWMALKLRFLTSPVSRIFNRKKVLK